MYVRFKKYLTTGILIWLNTRVAIAFSYGQGGGTDRGRVFQTITI